MKPTLREIARCANVHVATASCVLNGARGSTRVSDETRQRVLDAAARLGYAPNRAAQQLKTQRSRIVGLLVGDLENPFFARMVSVCSEALEREGYDVILAVRRRDAASDLHLLEALMSRRIDGLLFWSETLTEARERVAASGLECSVVMGYGVPGRDNVCALQDTGIVDALNHLVAQKRQRIGYLAPAHTLSRTGDLRYACYLNYMAALGRQPQVYTYEGTAFDIAAARERAEEITREPILPDALLCFNDMAAMGTLMGFRRCGLSVPGDIAIVGGDDTPLAAQMEVPLSSIAYPLTEMCRTAAQMLVERIAAREKGEPDLPVRYVPLPTVLHVRQSSAIESVG